MFTTRRKGSHMPSAGISTALDSPLGKEADDESDLTSLEDGEAQAEGTTDSKVFDDSDLSSLAESPVELQTDESYQPSKVGLSIPRPTSKVGVRTYGKRTASGRSRDAPAMTTGGSKPGASPSRSKSKVQLKSSAKSTPKPPPALGGAAAGAAVPSPRSLPLLDLLGQTPKKRQASQQLSKSAGGSSASKSTKRTRVSADADSSESELEATRTPNAKSKGKGKGKAAAEGTSISAAPTPSKGPKRKGPTTDSSISLISRGELRRGKLDVDTANQPATATKGKPLRSTAKRKVASTGPGTAQQGFPDDIDGIISGRFVVSSDDEPAHSPVPSPSFIKDDETSVSDIVEWSPPEADQSLKIPGEAILAETKVKKFAGMFWPAIIQKYVPPRDKKTPEKYSVLFMDWTEEDITRNKFYTITDEGFATCKLGQFEVNESLHGSDEHDDLEDSFTAELSQLESLPTPSLPPPGKFFLLSTFDQVAYILPVINAIIADAYTPTKEKNAVFLKGGRGREALNKQVAPPKGTLTRKEVNEFVEILKWHALRLEPEDNSQQALLEHALDADPAALPALPLDSDGDLQRSDNLSPDGILRESPPPSIYSSSFPSSSLPPSSLPPSSLPPSSLPQTTDDASPSPSPPVTNENRDDTAVGDADDSVSMQDMQEVHVSSAQSALRFHDLSEREKISFCADVLLQEAIIQILLWRLGKRPTVDLGSDKEEIELRDTGMRIASEKDIAFTVMSLRHHAEKSIESKMRQDLVGGTSTRPKFRTRIRERDD